MNTEINETKHTEITMSELFSALKKFLVLIIAATVIFGAAAGVYAGLFVKTKYTAKIEFNVVNLLPENEYITDSMLAAASDIAWTCVEMVDKNVLLEEAVTRHKLDEYLGCDKSTAISSVARLISADKSSDTSSIFSVSVTSLNADLTLTVIQAIQDVMPDVVTELYKLTDDSVVCTTIKLVTRVYGIEDVRTVNASVLKYAVIGALIGAVLSYAIAFVIYITDTKVYDESTVKARFDSPVLGIIPEWDTEGGSGTRMTHRRALKSGTRDYNGKLISKETPFGVVEAFNTLRTNICYSSADESCPVYAITSDFSGAGKSVVSANIASSLSLFGKKTLLVECDLRRPELAAIFGVEKSAGISELLSGVKSSVDEIIATVPDTGLDVVFSGHIPPNPSELLGSERMREFIAQVKEKYDIIIIDTPPAFEVSDIGVIVPLVTGTVVVARSNYSDVNAIAASVELVSGIGGKIAGFVVNDVNYKATGAYRSKTYRYGKYRYYSYYKSKEN